MIDHSRDLIEFFGHLADDIVNSRDPKIKVIVLIKK